MLLDTDFHSVQWRSTYRPPVFCTAFPTSHTVVVFSIGTIVGHRDKMMSRTWLTPLWYVLYILMLCPYRDIIFSVSDICRSHIIVFSSLSCGKCDPAIYIPPIISLRLRSPFSRIDHKISPLATSVLASRTVHQCIVCGQRRLRRYSRRS